MVAYYRISRWLKQRRRFRRILGLVGRYIIVRLARVPGVEIRTSFDIGLGLLMNHPHDIVIGAGAQIGKNVTIYNGVTLGAKNLRAPDDPDRDRYPVLGDNVTVFSGAKIIGPITIGNGCIIGANSVVNRSFPAGSIIAGSPARDIRDKPARNLSE